jgi:uncharacterized protein (DUF2267 family)
MNASVITAFDRTIEKTNAWISDLMAELGWEEPERSYHALRAVLHALRDRLPVQEAADLSSQLPMLVRGIYYEGWSPSGKPIKERKKEEFLAHIADAFRGDLRVNAEHVARSVFKVIASHVTSGEVEDVKLCLPPQIRALWPE